MKRFIPKEKSIITKYIRDIHVINNFKFNLFIKMNILRFKGIIINLFDKKIIFIKCENVIISM